MADFIKRKEPFVLVGPEEYLDEIYSNYLSGKKKETISTILAGIAALGVSSLANLSESTIAIILSVLFIGGVFAFFSYGLSESAAIAAVAAIVGVSVAVIIVTIAIAIARGKLKVKKMNLGKSEKGDSGLVIEFE